MTEFKEIQIVHAGPIAETQIYIVEGWVTGEALIAGDDRGVVCLCLMPEMAPLLVKILNSKSDAMHTPEKVISSEVVADIVSDLTHDIALWLARLQKSPPISTRDSLRLRRRAATAGYRVTHPRGSGRAGWFVHDADGSVIAGPLNEDELREFVTGLWIDHKSKTRPE